jgi:hypothetical protein
MLERNQVVCRTNRIVGYRSAAGGEDQVALVAAQPF